MKYLITGGCGFIGSHLAHGLIHMGHSVVIADDLSSGKLENLPAELAPCIVDITTPGIYDTLLDNVDGCFHLAAIASVQRSHDEWLRTHQVNLGGLVALFETISHRKNKIPVVFASTAAAYDNLAVLPLKESAHCEPLSAYGVDKLACEAHARIATLIHGIPTIGLRFFNVYGPRQDVSSPYSGVISIFILRMKQDLPVTIYDDGNQSRDFTFVEDVVLTLVNAMQKLESKLVRHGIFNVCSGVATSINTLSTLIADITRSRSVIRHVTGRTGEVRNSRGDTTLTKKVLGFKASTALRDGLERTVLH